MKVAWPKGLIFDLDGTLVDTAGDVAAVLNAVLAEEHVLGFSHEEVERLMGGGIRALIERALQVRYRKGSQATIDRLYRRFLAIHSEHPLRHTKPFPHVAEVLTELARRQIPIGVCTNKAEAPARLILKKTGLAVQVSALVGGDSGHGLKPDPQPLQACVEKLGLRSADVVYVGDQGVDVATARAAGIPVIVVGYGYAGSAVSSLGADRSIECMAALPVALAGLAAGGPARRSLLSKEPSYPCASTSARPR
jgi:phosphoglycolate phosphatase